MNRNKIRQIIGCGVLFLLFLTAPVSSHANYDCPPHKRILFLSSYHQGMTWTDDIVQAVESKLDPIANDLILHIEHMDTKRYNGQDYLDSLYRAYETKYEELNFDLILASDNQAYDFLRRHRDKLFPGVPVVFGGVNDFQSTQLAGLDKFTGVAEVIDAAATLELALQKHPETEQVFIVNDYLKTGRAWKRTIQKQLAPFASRVKLSYSDNVSIEELEQQITQLGKNSIILLGVYFADRENHYVTFEHIGKALMHSSQVPAYCLLDFNVGMGVIGGRVIGGRNQGEAMAKIAGRILQGGKVSDFPVLESGASRFIFDANELTRFGIHSSDLPVDSLILNQPPVAYYVSRVALLVFIGVLLFISAFVLKLKIELRKRRQTEAAYQESEARVRALLNSTTHAMLGVDSEGQCSFCNPAALTLLGLKSDSELLGQRVHQFVHCTNFDEEQIYSEHCGVCQVCNPGTTLHLDETTLWRADCTSFSAELWALPVVANGKVEGGVVTFLDITGRLEQQKQNIRTAQLASLGELSASIAHEINNPIGGVINYAQVLLNKRKDDGELVTLLERIINEGERVATIVRNMLKYSRDSDDQKAPVKLLNIVLEVVSLLESHIRRSGAVLCYEFEDDIPLICCNEQQIEQVLINIVKNALQALADNHPKDRRLTLTAKQVVSDGSACVQLNVANNGPHIPERLLGKIMNPFVTTKPVGAGTGLGLSIAREIMKQHDGGFEIKSEPSGLTEMILTFPCECIQKVAS
jgi:PAS domain S-box-containing protein